MATSSTSLYCDGSINGVPFQHGQLTIEIDVEYIKSSTDDRPDPNWSFTDTQGHFHAFDKDGKTPTLKRVITGVCGDPECSCDGEYEYHDLACFVCEERVDPRWVDHGPTTIEAGRTTTCTLTVRGYDDSLSILTRPCSVVVDGSGLNLFGFMTPSNMRMDDQGTETELVGKLHNRLNGEDNR